jgi:hypothetical protein
MKEVHSLKLQNDGLEVEFEILLNASESLENDSRTQVIADGLHTVNAKLLITQESIDALNRDIDRLTNHADGIDYMVAVGSGIVAGIVDSFWVGEFSFERGKDWGSEKINNFVKKVAEKKGYKGEDLKGAITHLERNFGAPSDGVKDKFGGGLQHHLRDFAHHPTPVGLTFSMLTQFTRKAYGTNTKGVFQVKEVDETFIGKDVPQKFLFGTVFWFFHMVSDMAGSSTNPGAGTGLPGPILSLLKEVSSLPFFKSLNEDGNKEFSVWLSKLFNGTLLSERDENGKIIKESAELMRFDLRAELGIAHEIGRQAVPVILNECTVRGFYFIRRLALEIREKNITRISELKRVDWNNVKPAKNRTIVRMLTISTGTFTLLDMADAAIRAGIKSKGSPEAFLAQFILRVNFVGVGRFAIAVSTDAYMGVKRTKLRDERMYLYSEQLHMMNAKIFYSQAGVWIAAETAQQALNEVFSIMEQAVCAFQEAIREDNDHLSKFEQYVPKIEENNRKMICDIIEELEW